MITVSENIPTPKIISGQSTSYSHISIDKIFGSDTFIFLVIGIILLLLGLFLKRFRLNRIRVNRLHRSAS